MLILIATYLPSLLCGIHVVRTGREMFWLWLFIIGPVIAPIFYFFAVLVPEWMGGGTARRFGKAAQNALDPEKDYRLAKAALQDTPTVGNRMRLARAAEALNKWQEAETLWRESATGHFADDPAVLMGHALALLELDRHQDALDRLEALEKLGSEGHTPAAALAFARAYEGLGRFNEADGPYRYAADRLPGLEAAGRYVAFLVRAGRMDDARTGLEEVERRFSKINRALRTEARIWRDLAANAVATGR
ncbi:MAG: hypothetical protein GC189_07230 [Alphaproteobacteria bacterium]|nr:hypothetical protein [Alphaproteobacteria bacterium]